MQENTSQLPRRWERQRSKIPISLALDSDYLKADNSAIAIDISQRGAGIQTKLALVPGEWLKVAATGEISHTVAAQVVWTREDASSHSTYAGLEFLNTLAASNGLAMKSLRISDVLADARSDTSSIDCCPKCKSTSYRASRRRWYERLMKRPKMARCSNCHHRFPYSM
jgi:hypothetical protein